MAQPSAGETDSVVVASRRGHSANMSVLDVRRDGPPSIWRRVRRDAALLGAGNLGIIVAQLGFRWILIAALVPAAYGRLSLILSIYNTVWIIGASGLPNSVARYIAITGPAGDSAVIRSAVRASVWPTIAATALVATASGILLQSTLASLFAAIGLPALVYSLLAMGILRGRGRIGAAASIMPIAAVAEVCPLAVLWFVAIGVTPLSAFGVFCLGNVIGLVCGVIFTLRTAPRRASTIGLLNDGAQCSVPSPRKLLGFSIWLGLATIGLAVLPVVIRAAAALDSYTVVAVVDVALVLLGIPQRVGVVLVQAVVPHATRALRDGDMSLTISRREHFRIVVPFVLGAAVVAFTPIVGWFFGLIGRPEYARSAVYLAMALLASPARVLYGLVEGVLIAHREGRFMAITALSITSVAAAAIFAIAAMGSTPAAFAVFVVAVWMVYLVGLRRAHRLAVAHALGPAPATLGHERSVIPTC